MMYDYLVCDCETSVFAKGNPYSQRNKLCLVGIRDPSGKDHIFDIEYSGKGYADSLREIQKLLNQTKLLVLVNGKFDLSYLRRFGLDFSHCRVWDCQLVFFILSGQQHAYPSLNEMAEHYGFEQKLDEVAKLWEQGIDTTEVPLAMLTEYLSKDLLLTEQVYGKQNHLIRSKPQTLQRLISLSNQDLLVLLEMEWNGIRLNFEQMEKETQKVRQQIEQVKGNLDEYFHDAPPYCRNYNSGDCLSALLYGGTIIEPVRTLVGEYKTGAKAGQPRYSITPVAHNLPRRCEPPRGSELKKEGFFATNEETLRSIIGGKEVKQVVDSLLELSKLEKLVSTYYDGLKKLHEEKDWEPEYIHGQFNQCVARTGRLSSSSPNLQNFPPELDSMIITRF